jgi:hypothetical protein
VPGIRDHFGERVAEAPGLQTSAALCVAEEIDDVTVASDQRVDVADDDDRAHRATMSSGSRLLIAGTICRGARPREAL